MIQQIHPQDVAKMVEAGDPVFFLDVRHHWEHDHCAIAGSQLIPLPELASRLDELEAPEGSFIVVYCHHGIRSLSGAAILQQFGKTPVASMMGGIEAWSVLVDPTVPRY